MNQAEGNKDLSEGALFFNGVPDNRITIPFVFGLLNSSSPSTVLWLIIPVIIVALNSVSIAWPSTHIFQEIGKIVPAIANTDAAFSVILIAELFLVTTALNHLSPHAVFRQSIRATATSVTVRSMPFRHQPFDAATA